MCMCVCVCVCLCVSVWVLKTDNFITTSHFAFTLGRGFGPIQACPSVHLSIQLIDNDRAAVSVTADTLTKYG